MAQKKWIHGRRQYRLILLNIALNLKISTDGLPIPPGWRFTSASRWQISRYSYKAATWEILECLSPSVINCGLLNCALVCHLLGMVANRLGLVPWLSFHAATCRSKINVSCPLPTMVTIAVKKRAFAKHELARWTLTMAFLVGFSVTIANWGTLNLECQVLPSSLGQQTFGHASKQCPIVSSFHPRHRNLQWLSGSIGSYMTMERYSTTMEVRTNNQRTKGNIQLLLSNGKLSVHMFLFVPPSHFLFWGRTKFREGKNYVWLLCLFLNNIL